MRDGDISNETEPTVFIDGSLVYPCERQSQNLWGKLRHHNKPIEIGHISPEVWQGMLVLNAQFYIKIVDTLRIHPFREELDDYLNLAFNGIWNWASVKELYNMVELKRATGTPSIVAFVLHPKLIQTVPHWDRYNFIYQDIQSFLQVVS
jgi:hypothetical protein